MFKLTKFVVQDLLRNWIVLLYMAFLMLAGFGFFMLEGQVDKALLGILMLVLLLVPMVTIMLSNIYYYNMYELVVHILAQPLKSKTVLGCIYIRLAISFGLALLIRSGPPLLLMHPSAVSIICW